MSDENQLAKIQAQSQAIHVQIQKLIAKHKDISSTDTPKPYIETRADGFDYVDEGYMRSLLNEHFPIWSWEIKKYEILGDVEIIVHGKLIVVDEGLPRTFDAVASHRIAKNQKGYVNISNNLKSAYTDAFNVAVNRICNIADDVYRKVIPDLVLADHQKEVILGLLDGLNSTTVGNVKAGMKDLSINSMNYEATIRKLQTIKEKDNGIGN